MKAETLASGEEIHGEVHSPPPRSIYKALLEVLEFKSSFFPHFSLIERPSQKKKSSIHGIDVKSEMNTISLK